MSSIRLLFLLALLGGLASTPVLAYDADLYAGQDILVGNVNVDVDINGDVLVTYTIDDTDNDGDGIPEDEYWCLQYVHADLQLLPEDFPQTKKGNPTPGHFAVYEPVDCLSTVTLNLGPQPDEQYYVAAHAEIDNTAACQLEGDLFGTQANTGWIWAIDAVNCVASQLIDTGDPAPADTNVNSPNGLAYDAMNDVLYFSVSGSVSGSPEQPGSDLWYADLGSMTVGLVGSLFGHSAGGTFFMGDYWYVANNSDDLYQVDVDPLIETWYCDIDGAGDGLFRFGDSAFIPGTTTLIASTNGPAQNVFTADVSAGCSGFTVLCTDPGPGNAFSGVGECADQQQLSFGSNGLLYGHSTSGGEFFVVDTLTGLNDSLACDEFDTPDGIMNLYFTDLASGAQCVADRDETAWGDGIDFLGRNWATYIGPIDPIEPPLD